MWTVELQNYFQDLGLELVEAARCGDSAVSIGPTIMWALGTAALSKRLVSNLFRRFIFRRIPLWELIMQELVFTWMVVYGVRFWFLLVRLIKIASYLYLTDQVTVAEGEPNISLNPGYNTQQTILWLLGLTPLLTAIYIYTRPQFLHPMMIWITNSPWQRREMGPYGYYLHRPLAMSPTRQSLSTSHQLRRCYSESNIKAAVQSKRKRHSKSV